MRHLVFSFYVATLLLKFLSTAADFSFQFGLGKSLFVLGRRFRGGTGLHGASLVFRG
jgi:hypothetical protein